MAWAAAAPSRRSASSLVPAAARTTPRSAPRLHCRPRSPPHAGHPARAHRPEPACLRSGLPAAVTAGGAALGGAGAVQQPLHGGGGTGRWRRAAGALFRGSAAAHRPADDGGVGGATCRRGGRARIERQGLARRRAGGAGRRQRPWHAHRAAPGPPQPPLSAADLDAKAATVSSAAARPMREDAWRELRRMVDGLECLADGRAPLAALTAPRARLKRRPRRTPAPSGAPAASGWPRLGRRGCARTDAHVPAAA